MTRGLDDALAELPDRADRRAHARRRERSALEATDHDRAWVVHVDSGAVHVERDDRAVVPVDGIVTGWGCDVLAWLYGRDPSGAGLTASGDLSALRLPDWFPYP